jgi:hypothetical protein
MRGRVPLVLLPSAANAASIRSTSFCTRSRSFFNCATTADRVVMWDPGHDNIRPMSDVLTLLRSLAKENGIRTKCFKRWARKNRVRCKWCDSVRRFSQPAFLRRNYLRDIAAGKCVRCHKEAQQETNKRCAKCQAYHQTHKGKRRKGVS